MNLLTWRVRIQAGRAWQGWSHGGAVHILPPLVSSSNPTACSLGDIHLRFTWQAWHLEASTLVLRGRRGTYGTGLALVACLGGLGRRWRRGTLSGRCLRFAWQAWHLVTSTFILRGSCGTLLGRCGTTQHSPSFCVAGVALGDIHLLFAWQVWHLETSNGMPFTWQACTWRHPLWFCVAGVAHITLSYTIFYTFFFRGRRGTWRHPPSFHVAGVALGGIYLGFAWQAWHLWHLRHWAGSGLALVACLGGLGCRWRRGTLLGRRGTWWHPPSSCVAAAALFSLRGRRGTWRHPPSFHVAGVALGDIHLRFTWQAWHL